MRPLIVAGVLLGMGMGGFFDGIVLHQILQWHHLLSSAGYPTTNMENLQVNTLADGLFHAGTFVLTAAGLYALWRAARQATAAGSGRVLLGAGLTGWGGFNVVEGLIDHQVRTRLNRRGTRPQSQDGSQRSRRAAQRRSACG